MTNDFKENLLNYFVGKLPNKQGKEKEIINKISEIPRNTFNGYIPEKFTNFKIEGLVKDALTSNLILYGGYKDDSNNVHGIIIVVNQDFKPIKTYYEYDSGMKLNYIMALSQSEDNTFYFIESPSYPQGSSTDFSTTQKKFVMVNNFVQANKLTLRISYLLPYMNFYAYKIYKDVNSSYYCLVGRYLRDKIFSGIRIISLKVQVGTANEWKKYDDDGSGWLLGDCYVNFNENNELYISTIISSATIGDNRVALWIKNYNSDTLDFKVIKKFDYKPYIDTFTMDNQAMYLNKNEIYFVQNNQHWGIKGRLEDKYIGLYYYNNETNEFKTIYEKGLGKFDYSDIENIYIEENQGELYIQFNDNINSASKTANYYIQRYTNEWNPIKIAENKRFWYAYRSLYISNLYNMLNIIAYSNSFDNNYWEVLDILEIYNKLNYNGQSYRNINSMIPNSSILYDENNDVIFARNLYNKTISDRVTQSTIEIPNNYLNDVMIAKQDLISETNSIMVDNNNTITKNIYETLFINFINTLQMINKNDLNNPILNPTGAIRLNQSISQVQDYTSQKISKAIINYADNSNEIIPISFIPVGSVMRTEFTIYNSKGIINIELISEDEKTTYNTITGNFELNKTYTVSQDVTVEGLIIGG